MAGTLTLSGSAMPETFRCQTTRIGKEGFSKMEKIVLKHCV